MNSFEDGKEPRPQRWVLVLVTFLFAIVVLRTAWICDDAAITFRSVENLATGNGAVWNTGERVQVYTHPLWMLVLTGMRAMTGELFVSTMLLSIALATLGYAIVVLRIAPSVPAALFAGFVLIFSRAYTDFSTSGLETVLSHLLLLLFLQKQLGDERDSILPSALLAGLLVTNRMDTLLLVAPALAVRFLRYPSRQAFAKLLLGFSPFFLWVLFSTVYYGFPFPNTAYAKLNINVPWLQMVCQGFFYVAECIRTDPITIGVAAFGMIAPWIGENRRRWWPIAFGSSLYCAYILHIGGDFMVGRLFTLPFLVGTVLIIRCLRFDGFRTSAVAIGTMATLAWMTPLPPPVSSKSDYGMRELVASNYELSVLDERAMYYPHTGLLAVSSSPIVPEHPWVIKGLKAREKGPSVLTVGGIGLFGFFAGPEVFIVDRLALADPLLARIPRLTSPENWKAGHCERSIPPGYLETLRSGKNLIEDDDLAQYYDQLCRVTRGDLFTRERWIEIWNFATGANEHLLTSYLSSLD